MAQPPSSDNISIHTGHASDVTAPILQAIGSEGRATSSEHSGLGVHISNGRADILSAVGSEGRYTALGQHTLGTQISDTRAGLLSAMCSSGRQDSMEHQVINNQVNAGRADVLAALGSAGRQEGLEHQVINTNIQDTKSALLANMCSDGQQSAMAFNRAAVQLGDVRADVLIDQSRNAAANFVEHQNNRVETLKVRCELGKSLQDLSKEDAIMALKNKHSIIKHTDKRFCGLASGQEKIKCEIKESQKKTKIDLLKMQAALASQHAALATQAAHDTCEVKAAIVCSRDTIVALANEQRLECLRTQLQAAQDTVLLLRSQLDGLNRPQVVRQA